mgnify:FL=1
MKALIFGSRGFVGPHLADRLKELEYDVFEFDLKLGNDVRDYEQVRTAVELYQPDYIFNLTGMAYVPESQANPQRAVDIHIKGTINILEAVRQLGLPTRIHLASTSEEYGYTQGLSITEETATNPQTIYGTTKNAMTNIALDYTRRYGMHIVITRAFNHLGAGQGQQPVSASFARQIALIERGELDKLRHGNLESYRNFTDVRDIVRAYTDVINAEPGIYNVCSEVTITMEYLLSLFIENAKCPIETEVDERFYRVGNDGAFAASAEKIRHAVGWKPQIALDNSVREVLQDWRERLI